MNSLRIVLAQLRRRPLQTLLGIALLALGIGTLVFVTVSQTQLTRQLTRDAAGIDLVVGAKGSPLQLILSAIYHVDVPTGNIPLSSLAEVRANRLVARAIPVSLGDSFRGFRIVGTEAELVEHYGGRPAAGELWKLPMEAVIGADAARTTGLNVGARFAGTHGLAEDGAVHDNTMLTVVGVLAPTGTVLDRLILVNLETIWHAHEAEVANPAERRASAAEREVTALLVSYGSPVGAATVPRQINAESRLMAASPAAELARLFSVLGAGITTLRAFAWILVGSSLLALFVTLLSALEERRYDIAIMRLLGASGARVAWLLMLEAWLFAAVAVVLGVILGLTAVAIVGHWLAESRAFTLSAVELTPGLLTVIGAAALVATLAAALPAWRASRMNVAETLARG